MIYPGDPLIIIYMMIIIITITIIVIIESASPNHHEHLPFNFNYHQQCHDELPTMKQKAANCLVREGLPFQLVSFATMGMLHYKLPAVFSVVLISSSHFSNP